jgi:hypothetical protein
MIVCDKGGLNAQKVWNKSAKNYAEKKAEELFPSLKEGLVSLLFLMRGKCFLFCSPDLNGQKLTVFLFPALQFYKTSCMG